MKQFIDDIIAYVSTNINSDSDFSQEIIVDREYRYKKLVTPRIGILQVDNSDVSRYDTFDGECVSSIPLQFNIYMANMQVGNNAQTAQEVADIVADKVTNLFDKVRTTSWNRNIVGIRRSNGLPPQPLKENGSVYVAILRYEFQVNKNYETI